MQIESVAPAELDDILARVLAAPGNDRVAPQGQVGSFVRYVSACKLEWNAWRCRRGDRKTAALFVLLLPGKTAIAIFPAPDARDVVPEDQQALLAAGIRQLRERELHYLQALVETQAEGKRRLLEVAGFRHLTQLIYLRRDATYPWCDPPEPGEASWLAYDKAHHSAFVRVVAETYQNSQDCPELSGLRPVEDALAAHKAAGVFDPSLWELARVADEYVGCVLMARLTHGSLMELVYMGVVSSQRRRGIGSRLIRRALAQCRAVGIGELTAVVDQRNTPARQLYARFGFRPEAFREAYVCAR